MPTNGKRPLILVSNDDGIDAPGLSALAEAMRSLGEVFIAAPVHEQSAVGHAITIRDPVRAREVDLNIAEGVIAYSVKGTPADCVKLAVNQLLPRRPDLVVSGINRGPNTAVNVIYSGTVSAATEAAILGIDSIAFSLCSWEGGDYGPSQDVAQRIAARVLKQGLPPGILLNVNVPLLPLDQLRGILPTRQARSRWEESFHERVDPNNQPYYWLTGTFVNLDEGENTDIWAVDNGYVSVTPIHYDLTAHDYLESMRKWEWESESDGVPGAG